MSASKNIKLPELRIEAEDQTDSQISTDQPVEVLYQKMGNRWFAFSLVGDEVYFGSITQDAIDPFDLAS
jgi:hypothetical protein